VSDTSPTIGAIGAALARAQAAFGELLKDKEATVKMKAGGEYTYSYANLASAYEAIRLPLSAQEVAVVQQVTTTERSVSVRTVLVHSSGEWLAATITGGADTSDMRSLGSSITYLRRYGLLGLVGLAADDDDGEAARPPKGAAKGKPAGKGTPSSPKSEGVPDVVHEGHHPSFTEADGKAFAVALNKLNVPYDRLATWMQGESPKAVAIQDKLGIVPSRPSQWNTKLRDRLFKMVQADPAKFILAIEESPTAQQGD
jgi:hypothetical protein